MHHVYAKTITRKCPVRLSNANRVDGAVVNGGRNFRRKIQ